MNITFRVIHKITRSVLSEVFNSLDISFLKFGNIIFIGPLKKHIYSNEIEIKISSILPSFKRKINKNGKELLDRAAKITKGLVDYRGSFLQKEYFLSSINNVLLTGDSLALIKEPGKEIIAISSFYDLREYSRYPVYKTTQIKKIKKKERGIKYCVPFDHLAKKNIYQWILNCFPRLYFLSQDEFKEVILIVPELKKDSYQERTLTFLKKKYPHIQMEVIHKNEIWDIPTLILPSYITNIYNAYIPQQCVDFIRDIFDNSIHYTSNISQKYADMIYISRLKVRRRPMKDEILLCQRLEKLGFEIIYAEKLTVEEQVNKFHHARLVVAPHGAGLTNILFCKPKTQIVEIFPSYRPTPSFYFLALACKLDYFSFFSRENRSVFFKSDKPEDFILDQEALIKWLKPKIRKASLRD